MCCSNGYIYHFLDYMTLLLFGDANVIHNNNNNNYKLYLSVRYFNYEANWGTYEIKRYICKIAIKSNI